MSDTLPLIFPMLLSWHYGWKNKEESGRNKQNEEQNRCDNIIKALKCAIEAAEGFSVLFIGMGDIFSVITWSRPISSFTASSTTFLNWKGPLNSLHNDYSTKRLLYKTLILQNAYTTKRLYTKLLPTPKHYI